MKTKINKTLRYIMLAQLASDSGKNEVVPSDPRVKLCGGEGAYYGRYWAKPKYILSAIKIIDSNKPFGINYNVKMEPDQNGYPSYIVYFDIGAGIIPGIEKRKQISFHNPISTTKVFKGYVGKGRTTRWNKNAGESKWVSYKIAEYLCSLNDASPA